MQKKILFNLFLGILLINSVSAYGFYSSYSLSDLLYNLDASMVILGATFIILFAFLNFSLSKVFKDQKATAGVVAFAISFLAIYGINKTGLDFESFFYNYFNISGDALFWIGTLIVIGLIIYSFIKLSINKTLILLGAIFIVVPWALEWYNAGALTIIGLILFVIGAYLWRKKEKNK